MDNLYIYTLIVYATHFFVLQTYGIVLSSTIYQAWNKLCGVIYCTFNIRFDFYYDLCSCVRSRFGFGYVNNINIYAYNVCNPLTILPCLKIDIKLQIFSIFIKLSFERNSCSTYLVLPHFSLTTRVCLRHCLKIIKPIYTVVLLQPPRYFNSIIFGVLLLICLARLQCMQPIR